MWDFQRAVDRTSEMAFLHGTMALFSRCERAGTVRHRLQLNVGRSVGRGLKKCSTKAII